MIEQEQYMDELSFHLPTCYEEGIVPNGRGIPLDILDTGADCGPSSLAAYLNISTVEAIELLPLWKEKRRHSSKRTLEALASVGKPHRRVNLDIGVKSIGEVSDEFPVGFAEARFLKRDGKEFSIRHIFAYDHNRYGELLIYDNNARIEEVQGSWIPERTWLSQILRWSQNFFHSPGPVADYYLRHVLVPSDG